MFTGETAPTPAPEAIVRPTATQSPLPPTSPAPTMALTQAPSVAASRAAQHLSTSALVDPAYDHVTTPIVVRRISGADILEEQAGGRPLAVSESDGWLVAVVGMVIVARKVTKIPHPLMT